MCLPPPFLIAADNTETKRREKKGPGLRQQITSSQSTHLLGGSLFSVGNVTFQKMVGILTGKVRFLPVLTDVSNPHVVL